MPRTPDGGWDLDDTVPSFAGIKKSQAKGDPVKPKLKMAKKDPAAHRFVIHQKDVTISKANTKEFVSVPVTDESLDAYEKERLAGLEKLAKVAPAGVKGPKWVPPKLNDDGSLADA
jgi:hypothetical protein